MGCYLSQLRFDPGVGQHKTICKLYGGLPANLFKDEGVITVPATYALRAWDVPERELLALKAADGLHHSIHADLQG